MGKLKRRHKGEVIDYKQPSCMWGIIHVLDYHYWRSNVRKIVHNSHHKSATPLSCHWSPEAKHGSPDAQRIEEIFDIEETSYHCTIKKSHASNRWSLKGRIKSLFAEDLLKDKCDITNEPSLKSSLQRKDSIHHLECLGAEYDEICPDWKHKVVFIPGSVVQKDEEDHEFKGKIDDILDIFKVDKSLFMRQVQDSDKGVVDSSLELNLKAKLSKSRSFPVVELSQGRKLKPRKLENKQKEVWPFLKEDISQVSRSSCFDLSTQHYTVKRFHRRSWSLNESLEQYKKLHPSTSLKIENENGRGLVPFGWIRSLSNGGYYSSNVNISIVGDDVTLKDLNITEKDGGEEDERENVEGTEVKLKIDDLSYEEEIEFRPEIAPKELQDMRLVFDSETYKDETASHVMEFQFSQDAENISYSDELTSSMSTKTKTWLSNKDYRKKDHNSDTYYIQHFLEQSGIAKTFDEQQLSPRIFEKVEASWPHDREELDGWPNFDGCWHHMMLFHLVNDILLGIYDIPYYPKPLSRSCHVCSLPLRRNIIEDVIAKFGKLVNAELVKIESLDSLVSRDLESDRSWMNLQFESESMGLEIEDVIFDDILNEIISPC